MPTVIVSPRNPARAARRKAVRLWERGRDGDLGRGRRRDLGLHHLGHRALTDGIHALVHGSLDTVEDLNLGKAQEDVSGDG